MRFAKWSFRLAAIYGILLLAPFYVLEKAIASASVPIAHPEYFYGFVGTALAAQLLFLLISTDPQRYRPAMPIAVLGKVSFGIPAWILWLEGRIGGDVTALGTVDLFLAACFAISWLLTPGQGRDEPARSGTGR
jgi:hypothetical protein